LLFQEIDDHQPQDLKINPPDKEKLFELYKELEFKVWIADLSGQVKTGSAQSGTATADLFSGDATASNPPAR